MGDAMLKGTWLGLSLTAMRLLSFIPLVFFIIGTPLLVYYKLRQAKYGDPNRSKLKHR
eukprot:COSAG04_NODE_7171_length_1175_cov_1.369888_2_plen_57_part_01